MARPRLGDSDTRRLDMRITTEALADIDDWQARHGVASRSEAIRLLCSFGIEAHKLLPVAVEDMQRGCG